ncbi:ring canal kelch-like protein, partial [Dinothrombium tinctorium]
NNNRNLYYDMEIYVEQDTYKVHRFIIACFIPFLFHRLAKQSDNQLMKPIARIRLKNVPSIAIQNIVEYLYTGSMRPTEMNFEPVLETSIKCFMHDFADRWIDAFEAKLGAVVLQMLFRLRLAQKYQWKEYVKLLTEAIALDFENLLITDSFEKLTHEEIANFLRQDEINVESEVVLFLAAIKWLNANWIERKKFAVFLMQQIRFEFMTEMELFACLNPPILNEIIEIDSVKMMIADALL